jgi:hypothetical protein
LKDVDSEREEMLIVFTKRGDRGATTFSTATFNITTLSIAIKNETQHTIQ